MSAIGRSWRALAGLTGVLLVAACGHATDASSQGIASGQQRAGDMTSQPVQPAGQPPEDLLRLRPALIKDPGFFGREMVAMSMMVPVGWVDQGAVRWADTLCQSRMQQIQWEARSPDGRERIQILPAEGWQATRSNMGGTGPNPNTCPERSLSSLREYIDAWIADNRPGARVLDFEINAELSQAMMASAPQPVAVEGMQSRNRAEAGRALLAYHDNGMEVREVLVTGVYLFFNQMSMPDYGSGYALHSETLVGSTLPMFTARAPAGELDFDRFEMLTATLNQNPEYVAEVSRHLAVMNGIAVDGASDRHAIRMDAIQYVGRLNRESFDNRMASMDRASHQRSQAIREVQTWVDPVSRQPVELPMHYRNAWRMSDGTYLMTDSDGFDPWRDLQLNGERMTIGQ